MDWLRHWWHRLLAGAFYATWVADMILPSWLLGPFDEWVYSLLFGALFVQIERYKKRQKKS